MSASPPAEQCDEAEAGRGQPQPHGADAAVGVKERRRSERKGDAPPADGDDAAIGVSRQAGSRSRTDTQSAWQGQGARDFLSLLFNSGYVSRKTAYKCMQVCHMWLQCVHAAPALWRRIEFRFTKKMWAAFGANRTQQTPDGIIARRPEELLLFGPDVSRGQLSAILQCNGRLAVLELLDVDVDAMRALDSLRAPLHTLRLCGAWVSPLNLNVLDLSVTDIGSASLRLIAAQFTQLSELVLSGCYKLSVAAAGLSHLAADSARTRTTLRKLYVERCGGIKGDITSHILAMPNLELLRVGHRSKEWLDNLQTAYSARYGRRIDTGKLL